MPIPNDTEAEIREAVHALLRDWLDPSPEATERFLARIADDFTGHGTGPGDYYADQDALRAMVRREHEGMSFPFTLDVPWMAVRLPRPSIALAEGQLRVEIDTGEETLVESPRFTFVLGREEGEPNDGRWLLHHFHFSVPDAMQSEGDTMDDIIWTRNRELERLVAERTAELEAAHREVRIEAALERVRARTMGMLQSEELADVAVVVFQELEGLGIAPRRCGFAIKRPEGAAWQFWHTTNQGQAIERAGTLTEEQVPVFEDVFAAWREQTVASATRTLSGDELHRVIHFLVEQTEVNLPDVAAEVQQGTYPSTVWFNFFFFTHGSLLAHTLQPLSDEDRATLERFAGVFDLAFARYEDFRQLEAKNRQVEEALAELRATQQQLIQSEKLASLGQLTAGIAHEIKNPLNFVNNFAALSRDLADELEAEADADERQAILVDLKTNAAKIEEHGRRADAIVRQMMEHARSGAGERESVDLNALVDEYVGLAYHGMRARRPGFNVTLEKDLADDVGEVTLVPQEIGRVLINLLDNAFDAVGQREKEEGGAYAPTVRVSTQRLGNGVEVRIEDNGTGMSRGVAERVFEPFFTTKPTGAGTGLGLSMSYDIVAHGHRGTLAVESEEGEGTVFRMVLPAS